MAKIHIFNVGHGDSAAIEIIATDQLIVIDAAKFKVGAGLEALLSERRSNGKPNIDLLCLSHPDWDHARGMVKLIEYVLTNEGQVKRFVTSPFTWKEFANQYPSEASARQAQHGTDGIRVLEEMIARLVQARKTEDLRERPSEAPVSFSTRSGAAFQILTASLFLLVEPNVRRVLRRRHTPGSIGSCGSPCGFLFVHFADRKACVDHDEVAQACFRRYSRDTPPKSTLAILIPLLS